MGSRTTRRRSAWILAIVAAAALLAAACGGSDDDNGATATTAAGNGGVDTFDYAGLAPATLNGSGSSFQDAFDQKAKVEFAKLASKVTVNYTKSGSGAGKTDLANQVVQYAGTDSLIKDADKASFKGGDVLYFPTVGAPITISYNVDGVDELNLSPETLAKIFQGTITAWDDDAIQADNEDADLPPTAITVVHRTDASGTTSNFTNYLKLAAAGVWTLDAGDTVAWPASTQGAEKNSGVASLVGTTDGAVAYVDLADAVNANLSLASVKNKAGSFVAPTLDAARAALDGATVNPNLTYSPLNADGEDAYPITSPTWIVVYENQTDPAVAAALRGWLTFILTDGQALANSVGYASLPEELAGRALAQVDSIAG